MRFRTERFKAFVDAVVAIAMTLLILPLMESVSEAASGKLSTAEFVIEHSGQLLSFGLSFVLIATFWMGHHRQYRDVEWITGPLQTVRYNGYPTMRIAGEPATGVSTVTSRAP